MIKTEKSILINAPVEEVFTYAADPKHLPEYFTGIERVDDVQSLPNGGFSAKTVYKLAGLHTDETGQTIEFVPNKRLVTESRSALADTKITAMFEPIEGTKTRVTCIEEHSIHGGFLGKLGEAFLDKYLEHAAEMTQVALKAHVEARVPATTFR